MSQVPPRMGEVPLEPPGFAARALAPYLLLPVDDVALPAGARTARVFRAGRGFLRYRYFKVAVGAIISIPEILFAVGGGLLAVHWALALAGVSLLVLIVAIVLLVSIAAIRLEYDLRQYIVTDRALRVRGGALKVSEATITFANIQDVEISQGPLQRYFGIADLVVHTAGGSSGSKHDSKGGSEHRGSLAGIENPREVRDFILERLRIYRDAGLGDPDDRKSRMMLPSHTEVSPTEVSAPGAAGPHGVVAPGELAAAISELRAVAAGLQAFVANHRGPTEN